MKIEEVKENLRNDIINNPRLYPFIAVFWEVDLINSIEQTENKIEIKYGHFNTTSFKSVPFHKSISKIIDLSEFI